MEFDLRSYSGSFPTEAACAVALWERVRRGEPCDLPDALTYLCASGDEIAVSDFRLLVDRLDSATMSAPHFAALEILISRVDDAGELVIDASSNCTDLQAFSAAVVIAEARWNGPEIGIEALRPCATLVVRRNPVGIADSALRRALSHAEYGRLLSTAASSADAELDGALLVERALHFATPEESVRIALNCVDPGAIDAVWSALVDRREGVNLLLRGRERPWMERAFGPTSRAFWVGPTGVIGFAGFAAISAALVVYSLGSLDLALAAFCVALLATRTLLNREVPAEFPSENLLSEAKRPAMAGLLACWVARDAIEHEEPAPLPVFDVIEAALDDVPEMWTPRIQVALSLADARILEGLSDRKRCIYESRLAVLEGALDQTRRRLAGRIDGAAPSDLVAALRDPETRDGALKLLDRTAIMPAVAAAVLELMDGATGEERSILLRYGFRSAVGESLRKRPSDHALHTGLDSRLSALGIAAQLTHESRWPRLIWSTGNRMSPAAQATIEELLRGQTLTEHSPGLVDVCMRLTAPSRSRLMRAIRDESSAVWTVLATAALGDDAEMWRVSLRDEPLAATILRRNAGPGAALGLWNIARSSKPASERRAGYQGLVELAQSYDAHPFDLLDEGIAKAERLDADVWKEIATARFSDAMLARTRWVPSEWRQAVGRPEMLEFARALVWGTFDPYGRLVDTFRVDESNELVDVHDSRFNLTGHLSIGLVHTSDMDDRTRLAWSELLADYELVAPIAQLDLWEIEAARVSAAGLRRLLARRSWIAGHPDQDRIFAFLVPMAELEATAVVEFEPGLGDDDGETQELVHVSFIDGVHFEEAPVPIRARLKDPERAEIAAREAITRDLASERD